MRNVVLMGLLPMLLVACSKEEVQEQSNASASADAPRPRAVYVSSLRKTSDPAVMKAQQDEMVDRMIHDPHVDLATIEGEAYRRGVKLTPEQIAFKKANPVNLGAPPGPAAPGPQDATAASTSPAVPARPSGPVS